MNATLRIHSAASAAQSVQLALGNVLTRVDKLIEQVRAAVREADEAQRAINDLAALNERQLRDIGLMRSDIEVAVRGLDRCGR